MLNQFKSYSLYYKKIAVLSIIINIIVMLASNNLIIVFLVKFLLLVLFFFLLKEASLRQKIKFYKMAGCSNLKLLSILYIYDLLLSLPILLILKAYI